MEVLQLHQIRPSYLSPINLVPILFSKSTCYRDIPNLYEVLPLVLVFSLTRIYPGSISRIKLTPLESAVTVIGKASVIAVRLRGDESRSS